MDINSLFIRNETAECNFYNTGISIYLQAYSMLILFLFYFNSWPWYFKHIGYTDVKMKLSLPVNSCGSFLIRDSPGDYTLSVRNNVSVVHYKIRSLASSKFCVVDLIAFDTIPELFEYYIKQSDGLCSRLTIPCMTEIHTEEGGNSIHLIKLLGKGKHSEVYEGLWGNAV